MPVNKDPQPSRSRQIANIVLWAATGLLLLNIAFSSFFGGQIAREPYSMFIHRVQEQEVMRASVGQNDSLPDQRRHHWRSGRCVHYDAHF